MELPLVEWIKCYWMELNWAKLNWTEIYEPVWWTCPLWDEQCYWIVWTGQMDLALMGWIALLNWTELNWIVWTRLMDLSLMEWIVLFSWTELTETDLNAPVSAMGQLHVPSSFHHCLHRLPRGRHPALWHLRRGQGADVLAVGRSRHGHRNGGRPLHSPYRCQRHSQQLRRHRELWVDLSF